MLDDNQTDLINNPLFTITRTTYEKNALNLGDILQNNAAKSVLMSFLGEGKGWKITAEKSFEKFYEKN